MKNANEMRIMAVNAIHNEQRIKDEKAKKYVEEVLCFEIERTAKMGKFETTIGIDHNVEIERVINYLEANDYKAETVNSYVRIAW